MRTPAALLPVVLLSGCVAYDEAPGELGAIFEAAEAEFGVPRDVLVAVAWTTTRLDQHLDTATGNSGPWVGVMGLRQGVAPDRDEAALLIGVNGELLAESRAQNVRAGAAWLADRASRWEERYRERIDTLEEWYPIVGQWSGADDPVVAEGFAAQVFDGIEYGIFAFTPDGEYLEVSPRELHWRNDRVATAGSSLVDQYIPASTSNYSNYSRGPADIDYVIIHTMQGSYSGCISWFQNPSASVSTHYVMRSSDGEITQMVDEEDVAWHAGNWDYNLRSIGIEHEGWVEQGDTWYTDAMYRASAALVADIADRNGIPKDRSHILAHSEVPGATHTDPGAYWDWDYYMELIQGGGSSGTPFDPSLEGERTGRFEAEVYLPRYDVRDRCEGDLSGQLVNDQLYLTGSCTGEDHPEKGEWRITWTGSVANGAVDGRVVVDGYSDAWTGTFDGDGRTTATMSGSQDVGGDVGTVEYKATIDAWR